MEAFEPLPFEEQDLQWHISTVIYTCDGKTLVDPVPSSRYLIVYNEKMDSIEFYKYKGETMESICAHINQIIALIACRKELVIPMNHQRQMVMEAMKYPPDLSN